MKRLIMIVLVIFINMSFLCLFAGEQDVEEKDRLDAKDYKGTFGKRKIWWRVC